MRMVRFRRDRLKVNDLRCIPRGAITKVRTTAHFCNGSRIPFIADADSGPLSRKADVSAFTPGVGGTTDLSGATRVPAFLATSGHSPPINWRRKMAHPDAGAECRPPRPKSGNNGPNFRRLHRRIFSLNLMRRGNSIRNSAHFVAVGRLRAPNPIRTFCAPS